MTVVQAGQRWMASQTPRVTCTVRFVRNGSARVDWDTEDVLHGIPLFSFRPAKYIEENWTLLYQTDDVDEPIFYLANELETT